MIVYIGVNLYARKKVELYVHNIFMTILLIRDLLNIFLRLLVFIR